MAALVLLSGGLDSAVAAALHQASGQTVGLGLFVHYGQRAAAQEQRAAQAVAQKLGFELLCTSLPVFSQTAGQPGTRGDGQDGSPASAEQGLAPGGGSPCAAIMEQGGELPRPSADELDGEGAQASADAVWVPNRNGLLVNLAAAVAEARGLETVLVGFNHEEAQTFPDNSLAFVSALEACLAHSTRGRVGVSAPCIELDKPGLVAAGRAVGAPMELTWSCYDGGSEPCGTCESCRRRQRALGPRA
ncbi:MAG: 7-cyano-7-deazaguanine synthase [Planctomycetota bacterium]|nr:MAG: 7-cyano-7-deazaguanine synthase [Planctomycetota bacterium]